MRAVLLRSVGVVAVGLAILAGILYYASTVDGRPPSVSRISLTQHLSGDPAAALVTTSLVVDFSEQVDAVSAQDAFRIEPAVEGAFSWSGSRMTFTPAERLPLRTSFVARVASGVRDPAGNAMETASDPFEFETVGNPLVVRTEPAADADEVALDSVISVEFSTLMDTASVEAALGIEPATEVSLRWAGEELTIEPGEPLTEGQAYTLRIDRTARDQAGIPLEEDFTLTFATLASDLEPTSVVPTDGLEGAAVISPIAIIFERELDPASVSDDLLAIEPSVPGSLAVAARPGAAGLADPARTVLQFVPSGPLDANTTYEVRLRPGLRGTDGSRLAAEVAWRFTTGAPLETLSNQIVFVSDRSGIANLWAMNPDGSGQRQVTAELSPVTGYAVSPDGGELVIGDGAILVEQRADGGDRRVLTESGVLEFDPTYAPDGARLAFGRAQLESGSGLGIWTRAAGGGDVEPIELPAEIDPGGSPAPTPSTGGGEAIPLLRVPRYSPDGAALAFIDEAGRLAVLELPADRLTTAPFRAVTMPVWLPDSTGLLISGLVEPGAPRLHEPGEPVAALEPDNAGLTEADLRTLRLVRLDRGAAAVTPSEYPAGATRPATSLAGRIGFVVIDAADVEGGGMLWVTNPDGGAAAPMLNDGGPHVLGLAFGPEQDSLVIGRFSQAGPAGDLPGGIWTVDAASGEGEPLVDDGWSPQWLP